MRAAADNSYLTKIAKNQRSIYLSNHEPFYQGKGANSLPKLLVIRCANKYYGVIPWFSKVGRLFRTYWGPLAGSA